MEFIAKYNKTIAAVIIGLLQILSVYANAAADGSVSPQEVQSIIQAAILALGGSGLVYAIPNKK